MSDLAELATDLTQAPVDRHEHAWKLPVLVGEGSP